MINWGDLKELTRCYKIRSIKYRHNHVLQLRYLATTMCRGQAWYTIDLEPLTSVYDVTARSKRLKL